MANNLDDLTFEGIEIKLGGKTFHLNYTFMGLRMLAKKHGSINKALAKLTDRSGEDDKDFMNDEMFDIISSFVLAGLIHENRKMTQEDVECLLTIQNMNYCFGKISEAMNNSLPQNDEMGNAKSQPE